VFAPEGQSRNGSNPCRCSGRGLPMSALGQKQTCAVQNSMSALPPTATAKADMPQMVMSALPPKADSCSATANVCFGPKADIMIPDPPKEAGRRRQKEE